MLFRSRHRILVSDDLEGLVLEHLEEAMRGHAEGLLEGEVREEGAEQEYAVWLRDRFGLQLPEELIRRALAG